MTLLSWFRPRPADEVTAATRAWLDHEARAEVSARAQLLSWQVRYGAARAELRDRNRAYGRASATIGALRGQLAREREGRLLVERLGRAGMLPVQGRPVDGPVDDVVDACIHAADCPGGECNCPGAAVEREHDATLVATAEQLGNEIQPDRTAAIEGAAITLRAHWLTVRTAPTECLCGWKWSGRQDHAEHVAEQLATVGALGGTATATPPDLIDGADDRWRWVPAGYSRSVERPKTREEVDVNWGPIREVEPEEVPF